MSWKLENVRQLEGGRLLSPYADWERETRADHARDIWTVTIQGTDGAPPITYTIELPLLMPVYIRVEGAHGAQVRENAKRILEAKSPLLAKPYDSYTGLEELTSLEADAAVVSELRYQIVYLCEPGVVPKDLGDALTVLHVGPVVPGVSLRHALMFRRDAQLTALEGRDTVAPGRAREEETGGETGNLPREMPWTSPEPVVTALIDAQIGIANERFRNPDGTTRVQRFWRQKRENLTQFHKINIGREFQANDIDGMLKEARGDERLFYELMCSGRCGAPRLCIHDDMLRGTPDQVALLINSLETYRELEGPAGLVRITSKGNAVALDDLLTSLRSATDKNSITLRAPPSVIDDVSRPLGLRAAHGSFVADLAAGAPQGEAPADRPIVAVELPDYVVADTAGQRLEIFCLMGVRRILDWVDDWQGTGKAVPVVINISLGNTAGPRDGTGFLEAEIARLLAAREERTKQPAKAVIAAGNSYRARLSAGMQLLTGSPGTLDWCVPPGSRAPAFLEIRMPDKVEAEIAPPGEGWQMIGTDGVQDLICAGLRVGRIYNQDDGGGRLLTMALAPTLTLDPPLALVPGPIPIPSVGQAPAGRYRLRLRNRADGPATIRIDVQRNDTLIGWPKYGRQSRLDHPTLSKRNPETGAHDLPDTGSPVARLHTLSAHGTSPAAQVFVVGGAVAGDPPRPARYSGAGPSYGPRVAPDLAAVSEDGPATPGRRAAGYLSGSTSVFRGTSSAAPQIARGIVEHLASGGAWDTKEDILNALLPDGISPDPCLRLGGGVTPLRPEPGRAQRCTNSI